MPVDTQPPDTQPPDTQPPTPDAQQLDFTCLNNTAPADGTALDPLPVSGTASDINLIAQTLEPVEGVAVVAVGANGDLGNDTTDAAGVFDLSLASGTNPIDGHIEGTKTGHRTMRVYPPSPLTAALTNVPLLMISESTFALFTSQVLMEAQDPTKGVVALIVTDCANTPIAGATPTVTQKGTAVGSMYDGSLLQDGLVLFVNVPEGETEVGATFDGMTLRSHTVDSVAGVTSATGVRPGF